MNKCDKYVGVGCVDGHCPIALHDEYAERGMDIIRNCSECWLYKGCVDCMFYNMDECVKKHGGVI